jgi:hypothetical protein
MIGIMRSLVDGRHSFHRRCERAVRFGRNDPALFVVELDNVFLSTRPIVLSLAWVTTFSSISESTKPFELIEASDEPPGAAIHRPIPPLYRANTGAGRRILLTDYPLYVLSFRHVLLALERHRHPAAALSSLFAGE